MGHKSAYVAQDLVVATIEEFVGRDIDLSFVARQVER